jgi:hypothetical protein
VCTKENSASTRMTASAARAASSAKHEEISSRSARRQHLPHRPRVSCRSCARRLRAHIANGNAAFGKGWVHDVWGRVVTKGRGRGGLYGRAHTLPCDKARVLLNISTFNRRVADCSDRCSRTAFKRPRNNRVKVRLSQPLIVRTVLLWTRVRGSRFVEARNYSTHRPLNHVIKYNCPTPRLNSRNRFTWYNHKSRTCLALRSGSK